MGMVATTWSKDAYTSDCRSNARAKRPTAAAEGLLRHTYAREAGQTKGVSPLAKHVHVRAVLVGSEEQTSPSVS